MQRRHCMFWCIMMIPVAMIVFGITMIVLNSDRHNNCLRMGNECDKLCDTGNSRDCSSCGVDYDVSCRKFNSQWTGLIFLIVIGVVSILLTAYCRYCSNFRCGPDEPICCWEKEVLTEISVNDSE